VYVCAPTAAVSSVPGEPDPFESRHEAIPGAAGASAHEKPVATA
jgi:hypothetical protein